MFRFVLEKLLAAANRRQAPHLQIARRGEQIAYEYLRGLGYRIVARNYRPRHGHCEIDLIGWDAGRLAIIEVKTRAHDGLAPPERAVDNEKRWKLIRAAHEYVRRAEIDPSVMRYDIVSIVLDSAPHIKLYKGAFTVRQQRLQRNWNDVSKRAAQPGRNPVRFQDDAER